MYVSNGIGMRLTVSLCA